MSGTSRYLRPTRGTGEQHLARLCRPSQRAQDAHSATSQKRGRPDFRVESSAARSPCKLVRPQRNWLVGRTDIRTSGGGRGRPREQAETGRRPAWGRRQRSGSRGFRWRHPRCACAAGLRPRRTFSSSTRTDDRVGTRRCPASNRKSPSQAARCCPCRNADRVHLAKTSCHCDRRIHGHSLPRRALWKPFSSRESRHWSRHGRRLVLLGRSVRFRRSDEPKAPPSSDVKQNIRRTRCAQRPICDRRRRTRPIASRPQTQEQDDAEENVSSQGQGFFGEKG